jgi:hypothetical protein
MVGIKETKEAVVFVCKLITACDQAAEGGFGLDDVMKFTGPLMAMPAAVSNAKEVKSEILDINEAEAAELKATVVEYLDLRADAAEEVAEAVIGAALSLISVVMMAREGKAA